MTTGLGIIPEVIVDQHFHNRNRMARLMSAIAAYPDRLGIGIDEDTCALFEGMDFCKSWVKALSPFWTQQKCPIPIIPKLGQRTQSAWGICGCMF